MNNLIIKGTGNSLTLKSVEGFLSLYPTYEDMAAALVAGELPIDIGPLNPQGVQQMGMALNKANLLSDATAETLGLPGDPTPNDALAKLNQLINSINSNLSITKGNCEIYCGTYTGTGAKAFSLTFPKLPVYIVMQMDKANNRIHQAFVAEGVSFYGNYTASYRDELSISGTTVTVIEAGSGESDVLNRNGILYRYMAFAPTSGDVPAVLG